MKKITFFGTLATILVMLLLAPAPTVQAIVGSNYPTHQPEPPGLAKSQAEMRAVEAALAKVAPGKGAWFDAFFNTCEDTPRGVVFKDHLYVAFGRANNTGEGAQVFRTKDGVAWEPSSQPAFGNALLPAGMYHTTYIHGFTVIKNRLYASLGWWYTDMATFWQPVGGQLWRTEDGLNWEKVIDLVADPHNEGIGFLTEFHGVIYTTTTNSFEGFEVWSSPSGDPGDWTKIAEDSFSTGLWPIGTPLYVFQDTLFVIPYGLMDENWSLVPLQIWSTRDGATWEALTEDGFGDPRATLAWNAVELKGDFYIGLSIYDPVQDRGWGRLMVTHNGSDWSLFKEESMWLGFLHNERVYDTYYDGGPVILRSSDLLNWERMDWGAFSDPSIYDLSLFAVFKGDMYFFAPDDQLNTHIYRWCAECSE